MSTSRYEEIVEQTGEEDHERIKANMGEKNEKRKRRPIRLGSSIYKKNMSRRRVPPV